MITTLGEIMLRISPKEAAERILHATDFEIRPGGSESNVAIALANLGLKSIFVTSLPDSPLGCKILRQLNTEGVTTEFIRMMNHRLGLYWTETGIGPRNSYVIYDRENSAFSNAAFEDFNWPEILKHTEWVHFSGISPALGANIADLLEKLTGIISCPYSVDLNYRTKLWGWVDKDPDKIKKVMSGLCSTAYLIAGNESDFQDIFGFRSSAQAETQKYRNIANQCFACFPTLQYIAISNRRSCSATLNRWSGYLFVRNDEDFCYKGIEYQLDTIQDRVGTGDSFVAGIIYGFLYTEVMTWQEIIDFAVTLGALNHTTRGDASNFSIEDVLSAMKSEGSGRIIR